MSGPSNVLLWFKHSTHNIKQLNQILAQTITAGLIRTIPTWNCIIRAYAKSPAPIQAILMYNHFMQCSSLLPDNHTFPALLKACGRLLSLPKGKEIHGYVVKVGLDSDVYIQNSLIHMYGVTIQIHDSRRLFDGMSQRDIVTWNSILAAYVANPSWQGEALVLYREMVFEGVEADEITMVILLSACTHLGALGYGRMVHVCMLKKGFVCVLNLDNALLGFYAKSEDMDAVFRLFGKMGPRDVVSYTIVINGYVELGLVDVAREIFDRIPSKDIVLWNSMISGYVKVKRPQEALELFHKMEMEMIKPDEMTVVSVLSACSNLSNLQFGRWVHQIMHRIDIRMDVFVGTALVDMYAKCGSLEDAVRTFYKMKYKDVFTWTAVIVGLANSGHGKEALSFFSQMQTEGIEPTEVTFVAVLTACSHSGLVDEGCYWFDRMVGVYKIRPKIEHLGCIIDLLSRAGLLCQAEGLIRTIPDEDRMISYKTLLSACIKYADIGIGEKVAKKLIELDPQSHGVYVLLSNFYSLAGQWEDVMEMRRIMKELDLNKEAGISFVEV
ncbi:pentatricopeptide repeat-containing protein At2g22410, mitochondrial-like [Magnolia sinica]|uniref:pentatricopeptide repeat-containing protein At2g22410, mitochondrial-like n=1 Tax=Magnolia sinica TaxID=86752 RepID=UPI002657F5F3|nr:pentatricopeptide repeat-containing protein At2g22410, mitochondrial-like [Magnolia sinica]